jgi:probable HAF family extracellular repeat protein
MTLKQVTMKNMNKLGMAAVFTVMLSGMMFGQKIFTVVPVPGTSPNAVISINNNGQVVVNMGTNNSYQVSIWNRVTGATQIGLSGTNSGGTAINASGDVVGAGDPSHSGNLQAFNWRPAQGVQWLGTLGGELSAAGGINASGAVVGLSYTSTNLQHAFLWTQAAGIQDITPTLTSVGGATATAINTSNQAAGYYFPNGARTTMGFTWTQAGGLQAFGPAGTLAFAINDAGTVVGQAPNANSNKHAFSYTAAGGVKDLGTLGGSSSSALSINNNNWIVGNSLTNNGTGFLHGFLWTPTGGMQDFITLAGFSANEATYSASVNDSGVVAVSTNKGGFLLVPTMNATVTSSLNPSVLGQAVTFTATVTSVVGPPPDGETVQFVVSGNVLGSAPLKNGVAQFTTSAIPVGKHAVAPNYAGDANYVPAKFVSVTQVVTK